MSLSADSRGKDRKAVLTESDKHVVYCIVQMCEKDKAEPKLVEKYDSWVTLTWFVAGREEIMQQHHYRTCTRSIFPLGFLHQQHTNSPCTTGSHREHCREETQTEQLTANQRGRNPFGCLVERKWGEREQRRM